MGEKCCSAEHKGHLCVLAGEKRFAEIQKLAHEPKFICFNCGRVAASEKNLCNPMPITE
jgi:hypothetical protein